MRDILFIPFSVKVLNRIEREWRDEEKIQPHIKVPNFLAPEVLRGNFKIDSLFMIELRLVYAEEVFPQKFAPEVLRGNFKIDSLFMIELRLVYAEDFIITDRRSWLKTGLVIL